MTLALEGKMLNLVTFETIVLPTVSFDITSFTLIQNKLEENKLYTIQRRLQAASWCFQLDPPAPVLLQRFIQAITALLLQSSESVL